MPREKRGITPIPTRFARDDFPQSVANARERARYGFDDCAKISRPVHDTYVSGIHILARVVRSGEPGRGVSRSTGSPTAVSR